MKRITLAEPAFPSWRNDPALDQSDKDLRDAQSALAKHEAALDEAVARVVAIEADLEAADSTKKANALEDQLEAAKRDEAAARAGVERAGRAVERATKLAAPVVAASQQRAAAACREELDRRAAAVFGAIEGLVEATEALKEITAHVEAEFPPTDPTWEEPLLAPPAVKNGPVTVLSSRAGGTSVQGLGLASDAAKRLFVVPHPVLGAAPLVMKQLLGWPNPTKARFVLNTFRAWGLAKR